MVTRGQNIGRVATRARGSTHCGLFPPHCGHVVPMLLLLRVLRGAYWAHSHLIGVCMGMVQGGEDADMDDAQEPGAEEDCMDLDPEGKDPEGKDAGEGDDGEADAERGGDPAEPGAGGEEEEPAGGEEGPAPGIGQEQEGEEEKKEEEEVEEGVDPAAVGGEQEAAQEQQQAGPRGLASAAPTAQVRGTWGEGEGLSCGFGR